MDVIASSSSKAGSGVGGSEGDVDGIASSSSKAGDVGGSKDAYQGIASSSSKAGDVGGSKASCQKAVSSSKIGDVGGSKVAYQKAASSSMAGHVGGSKASFPKAAISSSKAGGVDGSKASFPKVANSSSKAGGSKASFPEVALSCSKAGDVGGSKASGSGQGAMACYQVASSTCQRSWWVVQPPRLPMLRGVRQGFSLGDVTLKVLAMHSKKNCLAWFLVAMASGDLVLWGQLYKKTSSITQKSCKLVSIVLGCEMFFANGWLSEILALWWHT